jgi:hypothetical protein
MAKIYSFPSKEKQSYRIPLFSDIEVDAVLICVLIFGSDDKKYTYEDLGSIEPQTVVRCLKVGSESWFLSKEMKAIINNILNNVEVIP